MNLLCLNVIWVFLSPLFSSWQGLAFSLLLHLHCLWKFRSFSCHVYFLAEFYCCLPSLFLLISTLFWQFVLFHRQTSSASLFLRISESFYYLLFSTFNHVKHISLIFPLAFCYSCYQVQSHTYKTTFIFLVIMYLLLFLHSSQSFFSPFIFFNNWLVYCAQRIEVSHSNPLFPLNSHFPPKSILPSPKK